MLDPGGETRPRRGAGGVRRDVEAAAEWVDLVQVGSRNMSNFALLKAIGDAGSTLLLKRGVAATLKERRLAAEHALQVSRDTQFVHAAPAIPAHLGDR